MNDDKAAAQRLFATMKPPEEDLESAIRTLERCVRLDPDEAEYTSTLGLLLARTGKRDEGLRHTLRAVELAPTGALWWEQLGLCHVYRREAAAAVSAFQHALDLDPGPARGHYNLGTARLLSGDPAGAAEAFQAALARDATYSDAWHNLAVCHLRRKDTPAAVQALHKALDLDPDDAIAHLQLGRVHLQQEDPAAALPHLEAAVRLDVDNPLAHLARGQALAAQGMLEPAADALLNSLRREPAQFPAWSHLIGVLLDLGDEDGVDEAVEGCQKALPGPGTWYNLGALFANLERLDRARACFLTGQALAPGVAAFGQALAHLEHATTPGAAD